MNLYNCGSSIFSDCGLLCSQSQLINIVHDIPCLIKIFTFWVKLDERHCFVENWLYINSVAEKVMQLVLVMFDGIINVKFK